MELAEDFVSGLFKDDNKKLSKEEMEKIFSKYTTHFHEYMTGNYPKKKKEKVREIGRVETDILK